MQDLGIARRASTTAPLPAFGVSGLGLGFTHSHSLTLTLSRSQSLTLSLTHTPSRPLDAHQPRRVSLRAFRVSGLAFGVGFCEIRERRPNAHHIRETARLPARVQGVGLRFKV